jgi:hypothetical protein
MGQEILEDYLQELVDSGIIHSDVYDDILYLVKQL